MRQNVSLEEAQSAFLDLAKTVDMETVSIDKAVGRILAQEIFAPLNIPPFAKSALDGYALRAEDTSKASLAQPVSLQVIDEIRAGFTTDKVVVPGTAVKLMTGTPIPEGANVIIGYENVIRQGDQVLISRVLKNGDNVIIVGEDVKLGDPIAKRGTVITPPLIGVFASLGLNQIPVYRQLKIALISTGDELIDPAHKLSPGKIYNSSLYALEAQCRTLGAAPVRLGIVPDEIEVTAVNINAGLELADIVVTTGGASVGDYDVINDAIERVGATVLFRRVNMKPGSPVVGAVKNNKFIIGLSGNPAAAMVTFDLIAVPLIKKLMGIVNALPPRIELVMADDFPKASPQRRMLRAQLVREQGEDCVRLTGEQGNGVLLSMVNCNVLVDIPAGSGPVRYGQSVAGFLIGSPEQAYSINQIVGSGVKLATAMK